MDTFFFLAQAVSFPAGGCRVLYSVDNLDNLDNLDLGFGIWWMYKRLSPPIFREEGSSLIKDLKRYARLATFLALQSQGTFPPSEGKESTVERTGVTVTR